MVNNNPLNDVFTALSDPTRRAMLQRLSKNDMSVSSLSKPFELSKSAITKHLKILERAGLINREISGREHICSLNSSPLREASEWIQFYEKFWNQKFNALEAYLNLSKQT